MVRLRSSSIVNCASRMPFKTSPVLPATMQLLVLVVNLLVLTKRTYIPSHLTLLARSGYSL
jgi:hypothetical protein